MGPLSTRLGVPGVLALAIVAAPFLSAQPLSAQQGGESLADEDVTFTRDVAPIIQQNCQV